MIDPAAKWFQSCRYIINRDHRGVTSLEYGLIAGLTAVVVITSFIVFSHALANVYNSVGAGL
ncbi:MAG: Flp family type IVb pilin [Acidiphilium sp.]|nr:Flp family type IVb pilin [Acidiphilium sp.]MDD4936301.1 Flp family type IVb pilin [Acidiphilium sp.]